METEAKIPEDESAPKTILEERYLMKENRSPAELSTSDKSPTEYICKSEHCQVDKIENQILAKLPEDQKQNQIGALNKDFKTGGAEVDMEESTHHTEKEGAKVSWQASAEEPMTDQYKFSEVIAENTPKGLIIYQENENTRSEGGEDAGLECTEQPTSISETNMCLTRGAPLPSLNLTAKSQVEEDERVEKSCAKDETKDPTTYVEDEVKELSLDGAQKKEDMPSLLEAECKDPESVGSSDMLEHDNNAEDACKINVDESTFDATLKTGENVNDIKNPCTNLVTDGASTQVATEAKETLQEVSSTVCNDTIKDMSDDSRINLEKHQEEKRDSQPKNEQEGQLGEQVIMMPEETETAASREHAEKRAEQNILPVEEFEEVGEKDEPASKPGSGETSISTDKVPPLAEPITEIRGEENMFPQEIISSEGRKDDDLECTEKPTSTSETNMCLISEVPLPNLNLTSMGQGEEDERIEKSGAKDETKYPTINVEGEVKELSVDAALKKEDMPFLMEAECKDPESVGSSDMLEHDSNTEDASKINVEESKFDATLKTGENVNDIKNSCTDLVTDGASTQVATEARETLQEVSSTVCNNTNKDISDDSRINLEKHQEEKRDSQPKDEQEDQLGEQVILIPENAEIGASREDAGKSSNILPVEEFEEIEEKDKPASKPGSGETSISTEKVPPLSESIAKTKGEENMFPQEIAIDLDSMDPLVGETGEPDITGEVLKTEAREKHQESSKCCSENNEQDEYLSATQSTENLVVKHTDSEAMVTTETITKLTKDAEELQKFPDSHTEDRIGSKGDEEIISEETTEGEEAINKQLSSTESVSGDEEPSRLPTVASIRDEMIEQSCYEESLNDGESTLIEKNDSHRPKNEAAAEVLDLPNTRGRQDIYKQHIIEGSVEETLNNFQENEKQIQNLMDDPHEESEIKRKNHVSDLPSEIIQKNTGLEEGYSTAAHLYSNPNECSSAVSKRDVDSSFLDKPSTENICDLEHQILTKSQNEGLHQNGVEATEDNTTKEHHLDIEDDGAKISNLKSIEESNPKVHEETSMNNKHLEQYLELITYQDATFEVIPASMEKEMITSQTNENMTSKRDEDADLECNQQATSLFDKSSIKHEDMDTTMHFEDKFREIISTGLQNEKDGQVREVDWKDPESIRSSNKSGHENNKEFKIMTDGTEDASTVTVAPSSYIHSVEESNFETPSNNEDNYREKLENPSSSLVADGENTQVAIEAGEAMQDTSNASCQDNSQDICESARQEIDVPPVDEMDKAEDLACLNRDIRGEHEENIQTELPENNAESKINAETHDGEKRDLSHKNEQQHKVGEQAHLILENTEIEASRENEEKGMEQNTHPAQYFDVKEESTSAPNTMEKSISTEKSFSLVESMSEINNEEMISPQQIENNLNTDHAFVEEIGQPDSGDLVSKIEVPEQHQESREFYVEYNKHNEHHPETQSTENLIIKQVDSVMTTETISERTKDIEEIEKFPLPCPEENIDIEEDEKIIPEESKEMEEVTDKQSRETAKESISEDQAPSRLLTTLITDEITEQSTKEESLKDSESTLIVKVENHGAENDPEEKIKAVQASEPPKATGRNDIYGQHIVEGSVEGTTDQFQNNEKEIQDAGREIKGENYDSGLPSEFNQNTEQEERHSMIAQLESNLNKCSLAEFEGSVESSSPQESLTEQIFESEHLQADKTEAINNISTDEPDHDIDHDSTKSSMLAGAKKPSLKVCEEQTPIDNSNLDHHLKVLTEQHASFEVIRDSGEKEMITSQTNEDTKSKREEDADLVCNEQLTSTYEIILGKISEASLPNLDLATKSKGEEDESVIESSMKDEGIETTKHIDDASKDLCLAGKQNRKAKMTFIPQGEQKDPEYIGSSNKLERENNREEDAPITTIVQIPYVHSTEESILEAASKNDDEDYKGNPSSDPADGASPQVAIQAVETLQEVSYTACKDKNEDTCESVWPEEHVPPVDRMASAEDSAYLDRGANEENINQAGLTETIEDDSIINQETHDVEKRDSLKKNDQEYELGEQVVLIPEKTEAEAPREKAKKRIEQNLHSVEKFEEKEDEQTYTPDSKEALISTEKSLPLAESTREIKSEETIFSQNIASDLNTKIPMIEDSDKLDIVETHEETQIEAQEKFEDSRKFCTENDKQDERHSEAQSTENWVLKHMDSEEMVTAHTITKSTKDNEELDRVPESLSQAKKDTKDDEKITPEEQKEMEEITGVSEEEALSTSPRMAPVGEEQIEHTFQDESPKGGEAMIEKNESCIPEIDAEKEKNAVEAIDLPETKGRQDINEKHVIEESAEETMKSFQGDEMKIQILREDKRRNIERKSSVSGLPSEFIQQGKRDETILCESNETLENPEIVDISSKREEQILFREKCNPTPKEASIEDQDEYAYSMKVAEDKAHPSRQNFESITCTIGEKTSGQLEQFSQKEKIEEPKDMDGGKENKASYQEASEPSETEVSALEPEEEEMESTVGTLSSTTVEMDTRKEYTEEVECDQTKIKEEVGVTESEGQSEPSSRERKISNPLDDFSKPEEDHDVLTIEENNTLVKGSSSILGVPQKDSSSTNDSEAEFLRLVNENTALKGVKPVDEDHLEGSHGAHEMMGLTSETKSNCLGSDIAERRWAETNLENRDMEVKEVVDQEEQISHDIKERDLIAGSNHEIELATTDQAVHAITGSSMVPSYGGLETVEMSKTTDNTLAREDVLFVETEQPLITHTEGALMLASADDEKGKEKEYSNEGIREHNDEDQPMPPHLKAENITSESDTGDIVREKREQANDLADLNEACKLEIVEDEKSTMEVTKTLMQEEELTDKTEYSSAVTGLEGKAAGLKTEISGSQEEYLNTKNCELQMEKGDLVAKDQSEEMLLHSSNIQTVGKNNNLQDQDSGSVQEVTASNLKPRCNDEDLLNSSLDQDENMDAINLTHEVYQRSGMADNNESLREYPKEGIITPPEEETENEVEVPASKLTEQTESTKPTEGKKPLTLENQTEQIMEITDLRASKSTDASETNTDDSSATPEVYENETEASFIKNDDPPTDDPKIVPVIVEIEETGLKNSRTGHIEYDTRSVIVSENEGGTAIITDKTPSDSIDIVGREEENLAELNEGRLMDSCIEETDKTTTIQQEREQALSTISISQDSSTLLVEEKDTTGNAKIHPMDAKSTREEIIQEAAETYLVHSTENTSSEKEHEVLKPGGTSDLESVNITNECSNEDSPNRKMKLMKKMFR
ncbi:uncharacterized protein LOC129304483 isoform X2 [Prosopis cineraria]|uniref:uncharacterized protein LOC129304483 isoform X2 n=1 Tax=Prosopis cineraria TaxID=364024 RepID=UPI00240FA36C|nr:uncharacterized protein LOC129304483 isoform X2 [Prosopis cineraria]